jgi:hypothetical protein
VNASRTVSVESFRKSVHNDGFVDTVVPKKWQLKISNKLF